LLGELMLDAEEATLLLRKLLMLVSKKPVSHRATTLPPTSRRTETCDLDGDSVVRTGADTARPAGRADARVVIAAGRR